MFFSSKRYDLFHRHTTHPLTTQPYPSPNIFPVFDLESHQTLLHIVVTFSLPQSDLVTSDLFTLSIYQTKKHIPSSKMDIQTHPSNAAQAKTFIAPGSLSFPGGAGDLTPPSSEADKQNGQRQGSMNGVQQQSAQVQSGNGVTPATPAATPGAATTGVSGIVPTLQ